MTFVLNDLPGSIATYIDDNVSVEVSKPQTGTSSTLQVGDTANFTVTLTNKGAVRLLNVKYHMSISNPNDAKFKVPTSSLAYVYRADYGLPILHDTDSDTLLVEPVLTDLSTLEPDGGTLSFNGIIDMPHKGHDLVLSAHMHGDIDQASLFPTQQRGNGDSDSPPFAIK